MIIGIDAREIQKGVFTGIGRAINNFLNYFALLDDEHHIVLFSEKPLPVEYNSRCKSIVVASSPIRLVWDQIVLPHLIKKHCVNLFYSPYYKIPLFTLVPMVSTIFDLMYIYYPIQWKGNSLLTRWYYRFVGGLMAKKVQTIFTCSHYSKTEILRFYSTPSHKVHVIHLGLSDQYQPQTNKLLIEAVRNKFNISCPYILYTGNFKPHKNVHALIEAFDLVRIKKTEIHLVLAGNKDRYFEKLKEQIHTSPNASDIHTTGLVTMEEQIALYSGADAFVFPSLYEGFGYPPLEAMACGAPVVSSDRTSLAEIIGDAALRFDPGDISDMSNKIITILNDTALKNRLKEIGLSQAQKFTNTTFCKNFYTLLLSQGASHK